MSKHFYAAYSNHGLLLQKDQTQFYQFNSKKERDNWVNKNDMKNGNVNNRAFPVTYNMVYSTIGKIIDGVKILAWLRRFDCKGNIEICTYWGDWEKENVWE